MKSSLQCATASGRESRRMQVILPERRQERRYVTLKNAGIAGVGLVIAFLLLPVWSAFRPQSAAAGNLFRAPAHASDSTSTRTDPMIVGEGSIRDRPGTDSVLLDPEALGQFRAPAAAAIAPAPAARSTTVEERNFEHRTSQLGKGRRITISGGAEGVQVHAQEMPKP